MFLLQYKANIKVKLYLVEEDLENIRMDLLLKWGFVSRNNALLKT